MHITLLEQQIQADNSGSQLHSWCQQLQQAVQQLQAQLSKPALSIEDKQTLQQQITACYTATSVLITLALRYHGLQGWTQELQNTYC